MELSAKTSEQMALVASASGTATSTPKTTGYVEMALAHRLFAVAHTVAPTDAEAVTLRLLKASDASGTGAEVMKSKARTAHATNNDNNTLFLDLMAEEIDEAKPFIAASLITDGGAGTVCTLDLWATPLRYGPPGALNIATLH